MCKRHVFKGIVIWSILMGALSFILSALGFTFMFLGSPDRSTAMDMIIIPVIAITLTITLMMLFLGFMLYLLYRTNTTVWNTVHKNKEGIIKLIPDILGFLIYYGTIGLQWENRFKIGDEEES